MKRGVVKGNVVALIRYFGQSQEGVPDPIGPLSAAVKMDAVAGWIAQIEETPEDADLVLSAEAEWDGFFCNVKIEQVEVSEALFIDDVTIDDETATVHISGITFGDVLYALFDDEDQVIVDWQESNEFDVTNIEGILSFRVKDDAADDSYSIAIGDVETDFSEYTADEQPNDWTPRWVTDGPGWKVKEDAEATGGKVLHFERHSGLERRAISWDVLDGRKNVVIEYRFRGLEDGFSGDSPDPRSLIRGSGSEGNETGYVHGYRWGHDEIKLNKYVNGSFDAINEISVTKDYNQWYRCKVEIIDDEHKIKVWKDSDPEPADWDMEETDNDISDGGWIGLFSSTFRKYDIDWFKVASLD